MTTTQLGLPGIADAEVVVPAPGDGPGNWAGAATAVLVDGATYLAYRLRRPLGQGRGVSTVVARSLDGVRFEPVCEVYRDDLGAESFERPVVLRRPDGGWRLYLSCATPGSKHWWVEALDADSPEQLSDGVRTMVLPGDDVVAVKDPVVVVAADGEWRMWLCEHPLDEPGEEDRMSTSYLTSRDGLDWTRHDTVLTPAGDGWDARGTRVTAVLSLDPLVVTYDGRATKADNWHETTAIARADATGSLVPDDVAPLRSPYSDGAFRYLSAVPAPGGGVRYYAEMARPDGAHDLVTMRTD